MCLSSQTCVCIFDLIIKEKRRLAIRNAAQQWEGVKACLEPPPTNGSKEEASPENSPTHSPAQTNGLGQETSPEEPRWIQLLVFVFLLGRADILPIVFA